MSFKEWSLTFEGNIIYIKEDANFMYIKECSKGILCKYDKNKDTYEGEGSRKNKVYLTNIVNRIYCNRYGWTLFYRNFNLDSKDKIVLNVAYNNFFPITKKCIKSTNDTVALSTMMEATKWAKTKGVRANICVPKEGCTEGTYVIEVENGSDLAKVEHFLGVIRDRYLQSGVIYNNLKCRENKEILRLLTDCYKKELIKNGDKPEVGYKVKVGEVFEFEDEPNYQKRLISIQGKLYLIDYVYFYDKYIVAEDMEEYDMPFNWYHILNNSCLNILTDDDIFKCMEGVLCARGDMLKNK